VRTWKKGSWLAALALLSAAGLMVRAEQAASDERAAAPATREAVSAAPTEPLPEPAGAVPMVEFALEGTKVRGRLISETDQLIRVEPLGGGTIGYRKDAVGDLRRFSLSGEAYHEEYGDYWHERAWTADDPSAEFAKARQALQKALLYAGSDDARARLNAKLQAVSADREEWQKEALRKAEVEAARQQADLARAQKELTQERLAALKRQEQDIQRIQAALGETQRQIQHLLNVAVDVGRRLDRLEEDMDRLDRLDTIFITQSVFLDLKRAHLELKRQVDRLEQMIRR